MRKKGIVIAALVVVAGALAATLALTGGPSSSRAASHREAPLISNDPTADSTDLYAFVSPDNPDTVTIIADYVPFEEPSAGPNWYGFSTNAYYDVNIDNTGDAKPDITWRFQFQDTGNSHSSALPLGCIASPCQTYSITQIKGGQKSVIASNYPVAPNDIGPRTFPNGYAPVRAATVKSLPGGGQVFAGPADDPFFGDIGAAFDLVGFRFDLGSKGGGKDAFAGFNVHTIAIQVPKTALKGPSGDTIGVWTAASRPGLTVKGKKKVTTWKQVSRLANPLTNELLIPTSLKDEWGGDPPTLDSEYDKFLLDPILAPVVNKLYNLQIPTTNRTDLLAIFHQGLAGLNKFGTVDADMLRLNMSIPPTPDPNRLGAAVGDNAGWPNGRRLGDDVIDIALNGLEGLLYTPKYAPALLGDGVNSNDVPYLTSFPYVALPNEGFADSHGVVVNPPQP